MLVGAEIGIVEHRISIQDANYTHLIEIKTLRNHLRAYEKIRSAFREVCDKTFVGISCTCCIQIHSGNLGFRKDFRYLVFYLLGTKTTSHDFRTATVRTFRRNRISVTTIMASQQVDTLMQRKRDITVLTFRHPTTYLTFNHRRKTTTILKEDCLLPILQSLSYCSQKLWRERTAHHLTAAQVFYIHHLNFRQLNTFVSCLQLYQSILTLLRIIITLHRRRSRTQ